jgi:hypothetical protein
MGLFGKDPWAVNTISSKDMASLSRRAQQAMTGSVFDSKQVAKRKISQANRKNAKKN